MDVIDTLWGYSPFWVRWVRLAYFLATIGAVWCLLMLHGMTPEDVRWVILGIGIIYAIAALVMLIGTRYWTLRALGLLGTMTADAMLYTAGASAGFEWTEPPSVAYRTAVWSCFIVGGILLLAGLFMWLWRTRMGTRDEPDGSVV
jgi:uncharacterized transporter YbjL